MTDTWEFEDDGQSVPGEPADVEEGTPFGTEWQAADTDEDGVVDAAVLEDGTGAILVAVDATADGDVDLVAADLNGDDNPELTVLEDGSGGYVAQFDVEGDGVTDDVPMTREELEAAVPGLPEALDMNLADLPTAGIPEPADDATWDPSNYEGDGFEVRDGVLIGDPAGDAEHWFNQAQNGFCVPSSVAQIVSEYGGDHFADEEAFVQRANELGLFVVGMDGVPGMEPEGALALLESFGVPAAIETNGDLTTLAEYLDEGRSTMLFVDSGEIWYGEATEDNAMDHAVVITGIDVERGVVILSDPGTPDGNMMEVPADVFMDAWQDSGCMSVVADVSPEGATAEVVPTTAPVGMPEEATQPTESEPAAEPVFDPIQAPVGEDRGTDARDGVPAQIADAASWLTHHSWAMLPVTLGVGSLVARRL